MNYVYFTATLDAAVWGAELASGEGRGRIYLVEPTGPFKNEPNVTNQRFPGNPTQSFRSLAPLRIVGELTGWVGHPAATLQAMRDGRARRGTAPEPGTPVHTARGPSPSPSWCRAIDPHPAR
jgi:rifampin ADP-ribosylating transferase